MIAVILVFVLVSFVHATCPPGFQLSGPFCRKCDIGYYSNVSDSSSCTACNLGSYSNQRGSTSPACSGRCPPGYYCLLAPITKNSNKYPCPEGTFSNGGTFSCEMCPSGFFSSAGSSSCLSCGAGNCSGTIFSNSIKNMVKLDHNQNIKGKLIHSKHCLFDSIKCTTHHFEEDLNGDESDPVIKLTFVIAPKNNELLAKKLDDVSDPKSFNYGRHISHAEVVDLFHNIDAASVVTNWIKKTALEMNVLSTVANKGMFVVALVPKSCANKLLQTNFRKFQLKDKASASTTTTIFRAPSYFITESVSLLVTQVLDVITFPPRSVPNINFHYKSDHTNFGRSSTSLVNLKLLNYYYNIDSNIATGATQGVFEDAGENQYYIKSDLSTFSRRAGLPDLSSRVVLKLDGGAVNDYINGCNDFELHGSCTESMLDIEYMTAIAQNSETTFWLFQDSNLQSRYATMFTDFVVSLATDSNPPSVISISYGMDESEVEMEDTFNSVAKQLGLKGVTLVASSGDYGANNAVRAHGNDACSSSPSNTFPSSSPYVVSVGATQGPESGGPEVACSSATGGVITSGGGFSTLYPRPSYQADYVAEYQSKESTVPPLFRFPNGGRGSPDVSLLGYNYEVVVNSKYYAVSGTSASAPVFAGMLTLINAARVAAGKSTVGFVNPALYYFSKVRPQSFRDITSGDNFFTMGKQSKRCPYGYYASQGWDAVTGLGSVDFMNLKAAFLSLPDPKTDRNDSKNNYSTTYIIIGVCIVAVSFLVFSVWLTHFKYISPAVNFPDDNYRSLNT